MARVPGHDDARVTLPGDKRMTREEVATERNTTQSQISAAERALASRLAQDGPLTALQSPTVLAEFRSLGAALYAASEVVDMGDLGPAFQREAIQAVLDGEANALFENAHARGMKSYAGMIDQLKGRVTAQRTRMRLLALQAPQGGQS